MNKRMMRTGAFLVMVCSVFAVSPPALFAAADASGKWSMDIDHQPSVITIETVADGSTTRVTQTGKVGIPDPRSFLVQQSSDGTIRGSGGSTFSGQGITQEISYSLEGKVTEDNNPNDSVAGRVSYTITGYRIDRIPPHVPYMRADFSETCDSAVLGTDGKITGTVRGTFHEYSDTFTPAGRAAKVTSDAVYTGPVAVTVKKKPARASESSLGKPAPHQPAQGDPVNTANGNMYVIATDLAIPGKGPALAFIRTYNSQSSRSSALGYGWVHTYSAGIEYNSTIKRANVWDAQGRRLRFDDNLDGTFNAQYGEFSTLTKNAQGYVWTQKDGSTHHFDPQGLLLAIKDRYGNALTLAYDAQKRLSQVTDTGGRKLVFAYDAAGNLARLSDPAGNAYVFEHDAKGDLTAVSNPAGERVRYEYDAAHNMLRKFNPLGATVTFAYDAKDRCVSSIGESGYACVRFTYDDAALTVTATDSRSAATKYFYDTAGAVQKTVHPLGGMEEFTWDPDFNLVSRIDQRGGKWGFTYDGKGNLLRACDPSGNAAVMRYEPGFNQVSSLENALGNKLVNTYDAQGNLIETVDPLGAKTGFAYDARGQLLSVVDARGAKTEFGYDAYGNLVSVKDANGGVRSFSYDVLGRLLESRDPLDAVTRNAYVSGLARVSSITLPDSNSMRFEYDAAGRRTGVTAPDGAKTLFKYDVHGNVLSVTDPAGGKVSSAYDSEGNVVSVCDENGKFTRFEYDLEGRKTAETDPLGRRKQFRYDSAGNLIEMTDKKGRKITYEYDACGRMTRIVYPSATVAFTYDAAGRRSSMTDINGKTIYSYDAAGRLTGVDGPLADDVIEYKYDAAGARAQLLLPGGKTVAYGYDPVGRLAAITDWQQKKSVEFAYDAAGRVENAVYANGMKAEYEYDEMGRIIGLEVYKAALPAQKAAEFAYQYDKAGRRIRAESPGVVTNYQYDAKGQLLRETRVGAGAFQAAYTYDPAKNRLTYTDGSVSRRYVYNDMNQMVDEQVQYLKPGKKVVPVTGAVDVASGRVVSVTVNGAAAALEGSRFRADVALAEGKNTVTVTARNDAGKTATKTISVTYAPAVKVSYAYDDNGNLVRKQAGSAVTAYVYNSENRLTQVDKDGRRTEMRYDGEGRRIALTKEGKTKRYLYDGTEAVAEYAGETAGAPLAALYVRGPGVPGGVGGLVMEHRPGAGGALGSAGAAATAYYHYDAGGNVAAVTDAAAVLLGKVEYDAFGNELTVPQAAGIAMRTHRFATKPVDTTGLIYFGARYYDPRDGRFITADPLGMIDGPNLYAYCHNDPVNFVDPWGLLGEDIIKKQLQENYKDDFTESEMVVIATYIGKHVGVIGGTILLKDPTNKKELDALNKRVRKSLLKEKDESVINLFNKLDELINKLCQKKAEGC